MTADYEESKTHHEGQQDFIKEILNRTDGIPFDQEGSQGVFDHDSKLMI